MEFREQLILAAEALSEDYGRAISIMALDLSESDATKAAGLVGRLRVNKALSTVAMIKARQAEREKKAQEPRFRYSAVVKKKDECDMAPAQDKRGKPQLNEK